MIYKFYFKESYARDHQHHCDFGRRGVFRRVWHHDSFD